METNQNDFQDKGNPIDLHGTYSEEVALDKQGEEVDVSDEKFIPKIGMLFDNVKDAHGYYNEYARTVGFSIKIKRTNKHRRDSDKIILQTLCCSCEGTYTKVHTPKRKREERRFGCMAKFEVKLNKDGKFELTKFLADHSHELVPPSCSYLLRSHRGVKEPQVQIMKKMHSSGIQPSDIYYYFCAEAGGAEHVNFSHSDCNNLLQRERVEILKKGDAVCLLEYFKQRQQENKHFYYDILTNEESEIRGVFFCDALSRRDYALFGDVICFDTTFRTNNYNLVCAPIVGVNNHGQTTIFGCALLEGETSAAIIWMFETFLQVMGGKKPGTIFTDQSMAISNAIATVFPDAHHRLCIWHIFQNGAKHLATVFAEFKSFSKRFKECIYEPETIEEFEEGWEKLLQDFALVDNKWLQGLYKLREKWAQVYAHAYFCAGITTTQRSESINKFLKAFFPSNTLLRVFVVQYTKAMTCRRETEKEAETRMRQTAPDLASDWSIEHEASKVYTRKMFNLFQDEFKKTIDLRLTLESESGTIQIYKIEQLGKWKRTRIVTYNQLDQSVECTCRKFQFVGILCSHVLKVFRDRDLTSLPIQYYLKRWTRGITNDVVHDSYGEVIPSDIDPKCTARYSDLSHIFQRLVVKGSKSDSLYSIIKSKALEFEAEVEAIEKDEEKKDKNNKKKRKVASRDKAVPSPHEDVQLRNPPQKADRGEPKTRKKSCLEKNAPKKKNNSKKQDGGQQKDGSTQVHGGSSTFIQSTEANIDGEGKKQQNMVGFIGGTLSVHQPTQTSDAYFVGGVEKQNQTTIDMQGDQNNQASARRLDFSNL